jgi:hypothetical protein
MNRGFMLYRTILLTLAVLAFAINNPQGSNASEDVYSMDNPNDFPFSLPFDSDIASQSDGEDYQSDGDIPFP